ncbi:MAG: hypothetical protein V4556_14320 [Bacteroidota bacterium]
MLLLFINIHCYAQNAPAYDETVDEEYAEDEDEEYGYDYIDTALYFNSKHVSKDSIIAYKESKNFAYAKNLDSLLKSLKRAEEKNKKIDLKRRKSGSWLVSFFQSGVAQVIFWSLAAIFVLFILYKLFFIRGQLFKQKIQSNVMALPEEEELSMNTDYDKLINQSVNDKDYRLAVRYHYLKALQKLASTNLIMYAADKTNYQYVRELSGKAYHNDFANITLHYEYVWYGEFDIDELTYLKLEDSFKQFQSKL